MPRAKAPRSAPVGPVNCAIIGAGAIGYHHAEGLQQHPNARILAVVEPSATRAAEFTTRTGVPSAVADYREVLQRPDIHAVTIGVPNYLHARIALDALAAGKHVMLDKPMATNLREATRIAAAAEASGKVLLIGQNMRFLPEVLTARRWVAEGKLGDVYHAATAWRRRSGIPRIGSWFTQKKFAGGGALYDIGVHALDRCLFVLNDFAAASVTGMASARFGPHGTGEGGWGRSEIDPKRPFDVDDNAIALIKMKSGRTVLLEATWAIHQAEADINRTQLFGTSGGLAFSPLELYHATKTGYQTERLEGQPAIAPDNRMTHFIDCILGRAEPLVKPAEAVAIQSILDAIYRSSRTGREVRLS